MKKLITVFLLLSLLLSLCACGSSGSGVGSVLNTTISSSNDAPTEENASANITLSGSTATVDGRGAEANGSIVTIKAAGNYTISGKLDDGQIVINTGDDKGKVKIILNGADITCLTGPAILATVADNLKLYLADGTANTLTSGTEADIALCDESKTGGAIHTECDLDIKCEGTGSLTINGYINNGITCKADFELSSGTVVINAANNGIKGTKSVELKGGELTVNAGKDGIKATNLKTEGKGYVLISDGTVNVTAVGDGISAATTLTMEGGIVTVTTTGDSAEASAKGIKADGAITIADGSLTVNATGVALRTGADLTVNAGDLTLCSSESKGISVLGSINQNGGDISVTAKKAGIACGDASSGFGHTGGAYTLNAGSLLVSAAKLPIDALDSITVNGGSLLAVGAGTAPVFAGGQLGHGVAQLSGNAGSTVRCGSLSLDAAYAFSYVMVASGELSSGSSFTVSAGSSSAEGIAD